MSDEFKHLMFATEYNCGKKKALKASEQAKQLGCKSLKQISEQVGKPVQTLINWHRDSNALFVAVCVGVAAQNGKA